MAALDSLEALGNLKDIVCSAPYPIDLTNYDSALVPRGQRVQDTGVALSSSLSGWAWSGYFAIRARVTGASVSDSLLKTRLDYLGHFLQDITEKTHAALTACREQCSGRPEVWRGHAESLEQVLPQLELMNRVEDANARVTGIAQICIQNHTGKPHKRLDEGQLRDLLTKLPEIRAEVELLKLERILEKSLPLPALTHLAHDYIVGAGNSDVGLDAWIAALNQKEVPVAQLHHVLRHQVSLLELKGAATPDEVTARLEYALEESACVIFKQDPAYRAGIEAVKMRHRCSQLPDLTYAAIGEFRDSQVVQARLRPVCGYLFGRDQERDREMLSTLGQELQKVTDTMPASLLKEALFYTDEGRVVWALSSSATKKADLADLERFVQTAADDDAERAGQLMLTTELATADGAEAVRAQAVLSVDQRSIVDWLARHYFVDEATARQYVGHQLIPCANENGVLSIVPPNFQAILKAKVIAVYSLQERTEE